MPTATLEATQIPGPTMQRLAQIGSLDCGQANSRVLANSGTQVHGILEHARVMNPGKYQYLMLQLKDDLGFGRLFTCKFNASMRLVNAEGLTTVLTLRNHLVPGLVLSGTMMLRGVHCNLDDVECV